MPESWGGADGYEHLMGRWSRVLASRFLEWARVPPGEEVLDVGSGTGALSDALLRLGAKAVVGIDPSPAYVEYAASHVGPKGDASFKVASAMELPFPDGRFGAVVSSLVLNFVPDPLHAAREMRRVARRGGLIAACVWDYAGHMEMLRSFWDAAIALNPDARERDEGVRFAICNPQRLVDLFRGAAIGAIGVADIEIPMVFENFDDYWKPFLTGQGPSGGYAMSLTEEERGNLRELLRSRLRTRTDGRIALVARARAVRGLKE